MFIYDEHYASFWRHIMYSSIDTMWVLLAAALVFFMQAGFAMVETGFTRAKNAGNIIMKNIIDIAIGTIVFWVVGFGLMFGSDICGFLGAPDLFIHNDYGVDGSYPSMAYVLFQTVFCAAAATIVSGAMAERTKFSSYCMYSLIICALVYPISGHWIWGGGWLSELGFHDFAGSTAVHMVGGLAALVGAAMVGPRIGKYDKNGKSHAIPGHSLTLGALGVFILWFGWFGFNGGSTVSLTGDDTIIAASSILFNTMMAGAVSTIATMFITWALYKKPDISMTLNGALAGLVGITAGCDAVNPMGAAAIGLISAFVVVFGITFTEKKLKIDDPVGAFAVHGLCGGVGTILVGVFALDGGLIYGGGFHMIGIQTIGVAAVAVWVLATMGAAFYLIKKTIGLRVPKEVELSGLDIAEHGLASSYADFMPTLHLPSDVPDEQIEAPVQPVIPQVPGVVVSDYSSPAVDGEQKMTKVVIMTNRDKLGVLKSKMTSIGITGMTVSYVLGFGMQKGHTTLYRGSELDSTLLPKMKVEIIVCKIPVSTVVNAAKEAIYTGSIGDGKIFIYDVENVIKIRTGEEGCAALQDVEVN